MKTSVGWSERFRRNQNLYTTLVLLVAEGEVV